MTISSYSSFCMNYLERLQRSIGCLDVVDCLREKIRFACFPSHILALGVRVVESFATDPPHTGQSGTEMPRCPESPE